MSGSQFLPTVAIKLSELPIREKERYYDLILTNKIKVHKNHNSKYIASLRMLAPGIRKKYGTDSNYLKTYTDNDLDGLLAASSSTTGQGLSKVKVVGVPTFPYASYERFAQLISISTTVARPKVQSLSWLMKKIETIFDARYAAEKMENERDDAWAHEREDVSNVFPTFVVQSLATHLGMLAKIIDQNCWDLLYNVHLRRNDFLEVEVFARFLQEVYDNDDLLFFLFVRSVVMKILNVQFKTRWMKAESASIGQAKGLWMSYRECAQVARVVFRTEGDNEIAWRVFLRELQPHMVGKKSEQTDSRRIDIAQFMHLALVDYHRRRFQNNDTSFSTAAGGEKSLDDMTPLRSERYRQSLAMLRQQMVAHSHYVKKTGKPPGPLTLSPRRLQDSPVSDYRAEQYEGLGPRTELGGQVHQDTGSSPSYKMNENGNDIMERYGLDKYLEARRHRKRNESTGKGDVSGHEGADADGDISPRIVTLADIAGGSETMDVSERVKMAFENQGQGIQKSPEEYNTQSRTRRTISSAGAGMERIGRRILSAVSEGKSEDSDVDNDDDEPPEPPDDLIGIEGEIERGRDTIEASHNEVSTSSSQGRKNSLTTLFGGLGGSDGDPGTGAAARSGHGEYTDEGGLWRESPQSSASASRRSAGIGDARVASSGDNYNMRKRAGSAPSASAGTSRDVLLGSATEEDFEGEAEMELFEGGELLEDPFFEEEGALDEYAEIQVQREREFLSALCEPLNELLDDISEEVVSSLANHLRSVGSS
jgi:hypothetical protein